MSHDVLMWFHDTGLGKLARDQAWVFTTGLVLHFIGLTVLLGAMLVVDLRVLGMARSLPFREVFKLLPIAVGAFFVNLATGFTFFCFDPVGYWANPAFKVKLVLLLLAGLNALAFTAFEHSKLSKLPEGGSAPALAKVSAGASLGIWFVVILFGRLIVAFQGSPDLFK